MKVTVDRSGYAVTTSTTDRAFVAITAVVFVTSAIATIYLCRSMSQTMAMPGGWSMSMAWMRMPGQTWLGAASSFVWMWAVMMIAMMLPAIAPTLRAQRRFAMPVAAGYFFVWTAIGAAIYPIGIALALAAMRSPALARSVPVATGIAVLLAGCVQLTPWKLRELACCRTECEVSSDARRAWTYGLRSGVHCAVCCSGYMAAFLVLGVMNLGAMAVAGAAIAIERLSPRPERVVRVAGIFLIAVGTTLILRAVH